MMSEKKETVEIELDLLKRIAGYYEFPLAVFFDQAYWLFPKREKTQLEILRKKAEAFDKIREIVEEDT